MLRLRRNRDDKSRADKVKRTDLPAYRFARPEAIVDAKRNGAGGAPEDPLDAEAPRPSARA